jgi:hypothetical protein
MDNIEVRWCKTSHSMEIKIKLIEQLMQIRTNNQIKFPMHTISDGVIFPSKKNVSHQIKKEFQNFTKLETILRAIIT